MVLPSITKQILNIKANEKELFQRLQKNNQIKDILDRIDWSPIQSIAAN